jgi:transposase
LSVPPVYYQRNLVERFFNRLTTFRGIAAQYDRNRLNSLAAVKLLACRICCAV